MSRELTIIVIGPGHANTRFTFEERELSIGRVDGNDIVLRDLSISRGTRA